MRTRPGNDSFSLPVLETMSTCASFRNPSCHIRKYASEPCVPFCRWWPHLFLLMIQMLCNSKHPISNHISNPSLSYAQNRAESLSLLNPLVILQTGSWASPPASETKNLPTHKRTEKKRGFQLGELFCKYTKYFSSFLVLGNSISFP